MATSDRGRKGCCHGRLAAAQLGVLAQSVVRASDQALDSRGDGLVLQAMCKSCGACKVRLARTTPEKDRLGLGVEVLLAPEFGIRVNKTSG